MSKWHIRFRLNEGMINSALLAIEEQRPSLINYATPRLARANGAYFPIPDPMNGAKKFTEIEPLVLGQDSNQRLLADYCYQIRNLRIDFSPLADGRSENFRITADIAVGIGASDDLIDADLLLPNDRPGPSIDNYIDYTELKCFESKFKAVGVARFIRQRSKHMLLLQLTEFTVGAEGGIYAMVEFYIRTTINAVILPRAAMVIKPLEIDAPDENEPKIKIDVYPAGTGSISFSDDTLELNLLTA